MSEEIKDAAYYDAIRVKKQAEEKEKQNTNQRFADEVEFQMQSNLEKLLRRNKNENSKIN